MANVEVVLVARTQSISDLVESCARGDLPFSGPDSLCSKVHDMGFKTTGLYGAVMAFRADMEASPGHYKKSAESL